MTYKIYFSNAGLPATGLTPNWEHCWQLADPNVDVTASANSAMTVSEIGGGWYEFTASYGTAPFTVAELVGVIDGGDTLDDADRYVPVLVSVRDLALASLVNQATFDLENGVMRVLADDGATVELALTKSIVDNVETRTPGGE